MELLNMRLASDKSSQSQSTPKLIPKIYRQTIVFAHFWLIGTWWYKQVYTQDEAYKHLVVRGILPLKRAEDSAKGPQKLSSRAWLYSMTCNNIQVLFKRQNLIKAGGQYSVISYYEEYLRTNSHWLIARTLKAVNAKAVILTK